MAGSPTFVNRLLGENCNFLNDGPGFLPSARETIYKEASPPVTNFLNGETCSAYCRECVSVEVAIAVQRAPDRIQHVHSVTKDTRRGPDMFKKNQASAGF